MHLPSIASTDSAVLIATCGPDAERAQRLAMTYGAAWSTDDPRQVVGSPEIDAILVVTPHNAHASIAIAAAHAGKHVFCEKPLACTMDEARAMTCAVEETGVCHMVGFTWRNIPAAQLAQSMIAAGEIGQVLHVAAHFLRGGWLELPKKRLWQFDRRRAGSAILANLGAHLFDLLPWMIGQPIVRVCARLATFGPKPETPGQSPAFDDGHLLLDFASGAHGIVHISHITTTAQRPPFPDTHQGVEIYGETGALIYDLHAHSRLELRRPKQSAQIVQAPNPLPNSHDERKVMGEVGSRQIGRFICAIQTGTSAVPNFHAGLRTQAIIDAADRSHEANRWIEVDQE
jgi:predicted dehydrogenase